MAENINELLTRASSGGTVMLPSGEFEGPIYITKPLRLVGQNTTVWTKRGSAVVITCANAAIEDIRAELTDASEQDAVIVAQYPTAVKNVEILGTVSGFGEEDGFFDVPKTIELGELLGDEENTFVLTVNLPAPTEISCTNNGLSFSPAKLPKGRSELTVTVKAPSAGCYIYAEVLFKSLFTRRVYLTGRAKGDVEAAQAKRVYTAPERSESDVIPVAKAPERAVQLSAGTSGTVGNTPFTDVIAVNNIAPPVDMPLLELQKGQRVPLGQYIGSQCEIRFSCEKPAGMDIDPYLFLLDGDERSFGEHGLVFFGNEASDCGGVRYYPADGHASVDFDRIDYRVRRVTLAYSVYAGGAGKNFAQVRAPRVVLYSGGRERIAFTLSGLTTETTVVALEFYLYKGEWKLSAVGSGYRDGMAKLCNRYGIEVEE